MSDSPRWPSGEFAVNGKILCLRYDDLDCYFGYARDAWWIVKPGNPLTKQVNDEATIQMLAPHLSAWRARTVDHVINRREYDHAECMEAAGLI